MSASKRVRAKESASVTTSLHSEQRRGERGIESEQAYVASLRRSINQMKTGDVQPVHEGLKELRRELDTHAEDNPVDN